MVRKFRVSDLAPKALSPPRHKNTEVGAYATSCITRREPIKICTSRYPLRVLILCSHNSLLFIFVKGFGLLLISESSAFNFAQNNPSV